MPAHLIVPPGPSPSSTSTSATLVNGSSADNRNNGVFSFSDLEGMDPSQQLEALHSQLAVEHRIKEGAENLLNVNLTDTLRMQVESELTSAKNKIEAIQKQIDAHSSRKTKNVDSPSGAGQTHQRLRSKENVENRILDDSRAALHQATSCIRLLVSLNQSSAQEFPTSSSSKPGVHSQSPQDISQRIEAMENLIDILRRNLRVRYEINIVEVVQAALPALADSCTKQCRATAYRLIRHAFVDRESIQRLGNHVLDWFIVKSLSRDNKYAVEKEQAIKLIRTIVEIGAVRRGITAATSSNTVTLSEPIMRALIAVAEHGEDPFRPICIQTLAEILLLDIDLVARTGGVRFLLHVLGEGPTEIAPILAGVFLRIMDSPRTRAYLSVGTDLELALSAVTDAYGKGADHADRMRSCARVIQTVLRSWSGLMYFCMHDMLAIRSLVDTLRIPSLETREVILDMLFELFGIKAPDWHKHFLLGRRLTRIGHSPVELEAPSSEPELPERIKQRLKLTDQYIALLVLIFNNAGLMDALTSMMEESTTGTNLSRKATLLMAEILQLANRVLPLSVAAKIQTIPRVFNLASDYDHGENRIIGTLALSAIDSFNRNRTRLEPSTIKSIRPRANSVEDSRRRQRQIEQVKIKLGLQMDEKAFIAALNESQISTSKEHSRWNFEILLELVEGPLRNPARLEEAIKVSRHIRRLMSFFHPRSHRFSDIPRTRANAKWIRLGCALLTTLLANPEGVKYLQTEDPFLPQIVWSFSQLDPFKPDPDPIFSKKRVAETLTYGYFEMLGTLSKHKDGVELMSQFKVFTAFYHLSELRSREDLIKGIIENLDYSIDGHPRIILSKALTSSYKNIRLYATRHLGELIHNSATANAWILRLLVTQLYDPSPEVCEMAAHFLEEACGSKDILHLVVEMQPMMDHLGEIGHPLLMKFISTPMGFRYLYDSGYIDREMDTWFHERNIDYVIQVEVFLAKAFKSSGALDDADDIIAFDGTVPPHFYGEMAKTEFGCQILQDKGHFADFAHFIRQHSHENEDADLIMKLKSILWAVGNIGATEGGLPFLEEEEVIPAILDIAEQSPIPSVRGTCFFVLGLISSTSQGAEILDDYQWEATVCPLGLPTGLCIPMDLDKFISLPAWTDLIQDPCQNQLRPPSNEAEMEVMTAIQNLANTVIANAASRSLAKMKSRAEYKSIFSSPEMFYRALHAISTQRFRLPVRRYIIDLFNVELNSDTVAIFTKYAETLKLKAASLPAKSDSHRISVFARLGRRPGSDSDDDDDELEPTGKPNTFVEDRPVISLRPVSKIIGFAM